MSATHELSYDARWGHFLQTDPVGYGADLSLYAYAYNDPTNLVDPTGNEPRGRYAGRAGDGRTLRTTDNYRQVEREAAGGGSNAWRVGGRAALGIGTFLGALAGASTQNNAHDAGFSTAEQRIMMQADRMLQSPGMRALENAAEQGIERTAQIEGVEVTLVPSLPGQGMTWGEGFLLSPNAFSSQGELAETVLQETYRLATSPSLASGAVSGEAAAAETQDAAAFARRAREYMYEER